MRASLRSLEAAERRQQREEKKRQRELERQTKESARLSVLERARLEVETFENSLDLLLSFHKERPEEVDWPAIAASLPPVPPRRQSLNEVKARLRLAFYGDEGESAAMSQAQSLDEREYQEALKGYAIEHAEWKKLSNLARRILEGEKRAYMEAIQELSPLTEIAGIGSSLRFSVHDSGMMECLLSTNGRQAIPAEVKSLTASGKLSAKPMARSRFVEVLQDHVCGCVLRVARELFALLPIENVLITASAETLDTRTGRTELRPILSVLVPRRSLDTFNFEKLDPSDSIMGLTHRGDLKASRKTGEFDTVVPFTPTDLSEEPKGSADFRALFAPTRLLSAELEAQNAALGSQPENPLPSDGDG